jgi:hypothetical protein
MTPKEFNAALKRSRKQDGRAAYAFPPLSQVSAMFATAHDRGDTITNNEDGTSSSKIATAIYVTVWTRDNNLTHEGAAA